jgi:hypothetical protein
MTDKKPLDTPNLTLTQNKDSQRILSPMHDASAMSVYSRRFGWSRIVDKMVNSQTLLVDSLIGFAYYKLVEKSSY